MEKITVLTGVGPRLWLEKFKTFGKYFSHQDCLKIIDLKQLPRNLDFFITLFFLWILCITLFFSVGFSFSNLIPFSCINLDLVKSSLAMLTFNQKRVSEFQADIYIFHTVHLTGTVKLCAMSSVIFASAVTLYCTQLRLTSHDNPKKQGAWETTKNKSELGNQETIRLHMVTRKIKAYHSTDRADKTT